MRFTLFNSLYFKLSSIFLVVLMAFGGISLYLSINAANDYSHEVNQRLNDSLAIHTTQMISPYLKDGELNEKGIKDLLHAMMVINPIVEVYILDNEGKILEYVAPRKVVKLDKVSTGPIKEFLNRNNRKSLIFGDDPRNPGKKKIFSAAKFMGDQGIAGYVYIVLASQIYESVAHSLQESYILSITTRSVIIILAISSVVGLLLLWFLTTKLRVIIDTIKKFRQGDLTARIRVKNDSELDKVASTFNDMADTLQENIEALKGVDKLRKELISNISHDLKTPVAVIQGYAETLSLKKETLGQEEQQKYLETIIKSCQNLKTLINELFELSKLESGQVELKPEIFSIVELTQDIANKYRLLSSKRGINLNIIISKTSSPVKADIALIDRALQNLLDNAIKFCNEGDTISLEVFEQSGQVVVNVADTGPGIPVEELDNIFDRYYTKQNQQDFIPQGTGLGLAIVKKIVELHGSVIKVESQLRKGTTFSFALPAI